MTSSSWPPLATKATDFEPLQILEQERYFSQQQQNKKEGFYVFVVEGNGGGEEEDNDEERAVWGRGGVRGNMRCRVQL